MHELRIIVKMIDVGKKTFRDARLILLVHLENGRYFFFLCHCT